MKQKSWELKDRVRAEIYLKTHEDMPKRKKKLTCLASYFSGWSLHFFFSQISSWNPYPQSQ